MKYQYMYNVVNLENMPSEEVRHKDHVLHGPTHIKCPE